MGWLAGVTVVCLLSLTTLDVIGRYALNHPIKGASDISEMMLVTIAFFAMSYTQKEKGHVRVTLLLHRFPERTQFILDALQFLVASITYGLIAWNMGAKALRIMISPDEGPRSLVLGIPHLPFIYLVSFGSLLLSLQLLTDVYSAMRQFTSESQAK